MSAEEDNKLTRAELAAKFDVEKIQDRTDAALLIKTLHDMNMNIFAAGEKLGWSTLKLHQVSNTPEVMAAMERFRLRLEFEANVSQERLLAEVATVAFLDPAEVFDNQGYLKPLDQIPESARRAIQEIQVSSHLNGGSTKAKLCSKMDALKMLGSHFGTFVERREVKGELKLSLAELVRDFGSKGAPPTVDDDSGVTLPSLPLEVEAVVSDEEDFIG